MEFFFDLLLVINIFGNCRLNFLWNDENMCACYGHSWFFGANDRVLVILSSINLVEKQLRILCLHKSYRAENSTVNPVNWSLCKFIYFLAEKHGCVI